MADASASVRALFARHYLDKFLAEGIRPDGRAFAEARRTACAPGVIAAADGSASVQVGNTSVVAGVQLSPFCPPAVGSASGRVVVVVEVGQLGSSLSNARPDDHARALSDFVTRTLRQTRVVDEDGQLVIKRGVAAWTVTLTISCLNFDGNLLDALLLVAVAALLDTRVPAAELSDAGAVVERDEPAKALAVKTLPVCLTMALFENVERGTTDMVVDPTAEEERLSQATITVIVAPLARCGETGDAMEAPLMVYKAGGLPVSRACMVEAIKLARVRASGALAMLHVSV